MPIDPSLTDSFTEKTRQIDQAMKYTDGNMETARLMAAGQYNDVGVIKGKFYSDRANTYGIFYAFINVPRKIVLNLNAILFPNNTIVVRARIFNIWRTFYAEFGDYVAKEGATALPAFEFTRHLSASFTNYDIYADIEYNNLEILTEKITNIIKKYYAVPDVLCQVEFEKTSSLALEAAGIPMELPGMQDGEAISDLDSEEARKIAEIEAGADYILEGRVIISPIRGIDIKVLKTGDKIKILLSGNDERTMLLSKKLGALTDEGEKLPITVRVKDKIAMDKGGFFIYGLPAKNILVRIFEEENVKIEPGGAPRAQEEEKSRGGDGRLMIYLSLLIGIICILIIVLLAIL